MAKPGAHGIFGDSVMSRRTRDFAWETTALGPIDQWSDSLRSTVNFILASPLSSILMMGPQLITLYNDAYIPTLAERHPDALGMQGNVLWADAWEAVGSQIEQVLATGVAFKNENMLIPVVRDGVLTDTWFTYSFSPVTESRDHTVNGVMCMAQDVTSAHRAMLDLAESERKLARTADQLHQVMVATTDAVITIDRDWRFTYLNPAAVRSYGLGRDLLGQTIWDSFPLAAAPDSPIRIAHERAMLQRETATFEEYYSAPLDMWIAALIVPTPDGVVAFSRDVTDEKRRTAVLLQTEKLAAVGRLASSIAHEINNPLAAVTNLLYLAREEEDVQQVRELLSTADDELRRVSAIANQTLAFHKQSTRPREVTCESLVSSALNLYGGRLRNSGIRVEQRLTADCSMLVYEGEIRQVLNNLLSNAIDAMPHGGVLHLRNRAVLDCGNGRRGVALTVADSGSGIPADKLESIFEAFYTTKGIGGTGLGLWISKDILARHHGTLRVRSSQHPERHGTVFTMVLPADGAAVQAG